MGHSWGGLSPHISIVLTSAIFSHRLVTVAKLATVSFNLLACSLSLVSCKHTQRLGLFNLGVELSINQHLRNITRVEMEAEAGTDACGHFHVGPLSR